ncbi:reverse transcriptase/maturase family protein [Desemzia sp. C1]|uniref:reverse transcriptase/maturase family protein n=1 Tax=Desemzia sp. C1 TaxID=2892016 RepID=UPI001E3D4CCF|nr:reverse transcriptase/maturase family protein [Desemzia sp. C1]MCI3027671.1 reverse transcriptase/maturase family protein [Desemzia sp. C1]
MYQAYLAARKGKRYREEVLRFSANLEENLIEIQNELIFHTYEVGKYREFFVYEPKQRMIMALPFKDRVVQWAIYRVLNPLFEKQYYDHSYACRVGRGTHSAANKLQEWLRIVNKKPGKWYYLKMDISKYFYRVDHEILINIIENKTKDEELLSLLRLLINSESTEFGLPVASSLTDTNVREGDKGMPIGNLTSQLFANIYLNELDKFVKNELKARYYIRYMDDFVLLSNDKQELNQWKEEIISFLDEKLSLQTNNKTCIRPIALGIEFVGFRIWFTHKKLRKSTVRRMKTHLKYLQKQYGRNEIDVPRVHQAVMSYKGMLDQTDAHLLKNKLSQDGVFRRND